MSGHENGGGGASGLTGGGGAAAGGDGAGPNAGDAEKKGWLLKWTNYLKGYQRRWFVLSNGVLSYYRAEHGSGSSSRGRSAAGKLSIRRRRKGPRQENQAEMTHTCRGTISLHGALIHTVDSCTFVITNGGTQTFHIKAANEVERQSWVTALELAKAKAIHAMESDEEEDDSNALSVPSEEMNTVIRELSAKLENLKTCFELISKHNTALHRALTDYEGGEDLSAGRGKLVGERATLFRISSNAMVTACGEYLQTAQNQGHKWSKMLQHEREQRQHLEEMVEQLARQHSHLEKAAHRHRPNTVTSNTSDDDEDNEFYDAQEEGGSIASQEDSSFILKIPISSAARRTSNADATGSSSEGEEPKSETHQVLVVHETSADSTTAAADMDDTDRAAGQITKSASKSSALQRLTTAHTSRQRRLTVPEKPNYPLNLWSIMKNCIGKDLSKIPMPVNFNEPLSMLQRLTEDYEYTELLDKAAECSDPCEQLAYVAAFTISSYSTTANRTGKPFNPLLGETFECDRTEDLGWRCVAEQVSHHPPMAAIHCEGKGWVCWQEFTMASKFRGKYLQVIPSGSAYVQFKRTGHKYGWRKVTTTIHNIIVGKLWVDHHGDMEIVGKGTAAGINCVMKYIPYSYFSRDTQRKVKAVIMDRDAQVRWVLNGTWDSKIEIAPVISTSGSASSPVYTTGAYRTAWVRRMPANDSDKYYNFTEFACQLNEMEPGVAPSDSRLRPDQRLMEDGNWDVSNKEKLRLEEKQRIVRRQREADAEQAAADGRPFATYEPAWFVKTKDEDSEGLIHVFRNTYWDAKEQQDWSQCKQIF